MENVYLIDDTHGSRFSIYWVKRVNIRLVFGTFAYNTSSLLTFDVSRKYLLVWEFFYRRAFQDKNEYETLSFYFLLHRNFKVSRGK